MPTAKELMQEKIRQNEQLKAKMLENDIYIKVLKDLSGPTETIKKPTHIELARQIIIEAGRPLHANEIVDRLGWRKTLRNKVSIASTMAHYSNKGKVFKRVEPNTFDVLPNEQYKLRLNS